ncbi:hypothetical protein QWA_06555 [Alcaligenes faecalis subsp. faecalis NCIB 8687]|nr:hypothetical protein QWA_06555 [Alcaligenes faecalis subsp. faecalis NCIB 8687]
MKAPKSSTVSTSPTKAPISRRKSPANTSAAVAAGKRAVPLCSDPGHKAVREEQNGVKRPGPGKCLEVWEWLDENGNCMPKDLQPVAEAKGWNLNNAQIELYQWRKFNGIAGRQAKAAK